MTTDHKTLATDHALNALMARLDGVKDGAWPFRCLVAGHDNDEGIWCYACKTGVAEGGRVPPPYLDRADLAVPLARKVASFGRGEFTVDGWMFGVKTVRGIFSGAGKTLPAAICDALEQYAKTLPVLLLAAALAACSSSNPVAPQLAEPDLPCTNTCPPGGICPAVCIH